MNRMGALHSLAHVQSVACINANALGIFARRLGVEHPNTITIRKNYRVLLAEMGFSAAEIDKNMSQMAL